MKALSISRAIVFLLAGASTLDADIKVRGKVVAEGRAVAGASLRLVAAADRAEDFAWRFADVEIAELARARSGAQGEFELVAPEPGFYRLLVEADGFLGIAPTITVLTAARGRLNEIQLLPARRARLRVLDAEGRGSAARLRLAVDQKGKARRVPIWPEFYSIAADGAVTVALPRDEEAMAWIAAPGFAISRALLPIRGGDVEVRLQPGKALAVEVRDERGRLLPDVAIFVPDVGLPFGRTDREGKALVKILPDQEQWVLSDAEGRRTVVPRPAADPAAAGTGAAAAILKVRMDEIAVLTGQVLAMPGREPIAGAWVYLSGNPPIFTRSDRAGAFELVLPRGRRSQLHAFKEGFREETTQVSESSPDLAIGLEPAALLEGRVVDADGAGVGGAWVMAEPPLTSMSFLRRDAYASADADGYFTIENLPVGQSLEAYATFEKLESPKKEVLAQAPGEKIEIELRLPRVESLKCRVVDGDGRPIAGAELVARRIEPGQQHPGLIDNTLWSHSMPSLGATDQEGWIRIASLSAGLYDFGARARGFAPGWRTGVRIGRGEEGEEGPESVEIALQKALTARGKVLDDQGRAVEGATLHLGPVSGSFPGFRMLSRSPPVATSDAAGEFSFTEAAAEQRFQLLAQKEGYVPASLPDVVLGSGEPLLLRLSRGGLIEGQVKAGAVPVAGVHLSFEIEGDRGFFGWPGRRAVTDVQGRFLFDGIEPGQLRLVAQGPPGYQVYRSETFQIAAGDKKTFDVKLEKGAVIFGKVLLPTGEPVADVQVLFGRGDDTRQPRRQDASAMTDALGQYRIENATPGPGWVQLNGHQFRNTTRKADFAEGQNELDIVLERSSLEI